MKQYVVDAFTDQLFHGNPAAICVMDEWLPDEGMLGITSENSLSETAFAVKNEDGGYGLRWFTPGGEIDLCGHATLATAAVLMNIYDKRAKEIVFDTLSGQLKVVKNGDLFEMDFPAYKLKPVPVTYEMIDALGAKPREAYMGRDLLCVFDDAETVRKLKPNQSKLLELDGLLVHATAKAESYYSADCVSRSFAPKCNIPEDPVCGSGHCHIVPYWAEQLGKSDIHAYQASARGGTLYCTMLGDRVRLAGKTMLYAKSDIRY